MKILFRFQEIWDVVEKKFMEHIEKEEATLDATMKADLKDNRKRYQKALTFIHQVVDESIFENIATVKTSHEAWLILTRKYIKE